MNKKLFSVFLVLTVLLTAVSCAKPADDAPVETPQAVLEPTPDTTPVSAPVYTPPPEPTPITFPIDGYISKEGVNIRSEPTVSSAIVDVMGQNFPVHIVSLQNGWYRLDIEGKTAYVREDMAELGEPPRKHNMYMAKVNVKEAKLYKSPSDAEPSDRTLALDEEVKVLRTLDGYSHIVCSDFLQRYVLATEITKISENTEEQEG